MDRLGRRFLGLETSPFLGVCGRVVCRCLHRKDVDLLYAALVQVTAKHAARPQPENWQGDTVSAGSVTHPYRHLSSSSLPRTPLRAATTSRLPIAFCAFPGKKVAMPTGGRQTLCLRSSWPRTWTRNRRPWDCRVPHRRPDRGNPGPKTRKTGSETVGAVEAVEAVGVVWGGSTCPAGVGGSKGARHSIG